MRLFNDLSWLLGVFAFIALFVAGGHYFGAEKTGVVESIQLTELSTDELDLILAVKMEMQEARF